MLYCKWQKDHQSEESCPQLTQTHYSWPRHPIFVRGQGTSRLLDANLWYYFEIIYILHVPIVNMCWCFPTSNNLVYPLHFPCWFDPVPFCSMPAPHVFHLGCIIFHSVPFQNSWTLVPWRPAVALRCKALGQFIEKYCFVQYTILQRYFWKIQTWMHRNPTFSIVSRWHSKHSYLTANYFIRQVQR